MHELKSISNIILIYVYPADEQEQLPEGDCGYKRFWIYFWLLAFRLRVYSSFVSFKAFNLLGILVLLTWTSLWEIFAFNSWANRPVRAYRFRAYFTDKSSIGHAFETDGQDEQISRYSRINLLIKYALTNSFQHTVKEWYDKLHRVFR